MTTTSAARGMGRPKHRRDQKLKTMLEDRRRALLRDVQDKVRGARADGALERDVMDDSERSDIDGQSELRFALIQITAELLQKVDVALRRLHEGAYGDCIECLAPIDELRLRALPFAVRCTACEDALEATERRDRFTTSGHSSSLLFLDRTS